MYWIRIVAVAGMAANLNPALAAQAPDCDPAQRACFDVRVDLAVADERDRDAIRARSRNSTGSSGSMRGRND